MTGKKGEGVVWLRFAWVTFGGYPSAMKWWLILMLSGMVTGVDALGAEEDQGGLRWRDVPDAFHRFVSDPPQEMRLRYRNARGGSVRVDRISTDCECTVGAGEGRVIEPGGAGELVLRQRSPSRVGEQVRRVRVVTDHAPLHPAEFTFRLITHADPVLEPRVLSFRAGEVLRAQLRLPEIVDPESVRVVAAPKRFEVKLLPGRGVVEIEVRMRSRGEIEASAPIAEEVRLDLGFPVGSPRREVLYLRMSPNPAR